MFDSKLQTVRRWVGGISAITGPVCLAGLVVCELLSVVRGHRSDAVPRLSLSAMFSAMFFVGWFVQQLLAKIMMWEPDRKMPSKTIFSGFPTSSVFSVVSTLIFGVFWLMVRVSPIAHHAANSLPDPLLVRIAEIVLIPGMPLVDVFNLTVEGTLFRGNVVKSVKSVLCSHSLERA